MNQASKVVFILSSIDLEASLIGLVSNAIFYFGTKHHLITFHEIKHYSLKCRFKCFLINHIEEYLFIGSNLYSDIPFDVKDQTFMTEFIIHLPWANICVLVFLSFEEVNLSWWSSNQCLVVYQKHLTQILVNDLFLLDIILINFHSF